MQPVHITNQNQGQINDYPKWWLYRSSAYLTGMGASFGFPIVPHTAKQPEKSNVNFDCLLTPYMDVFSAVPYIIADNKLDHVFIGPRLGMIDSPQKLLKDFSQKLHVGGHLVVAQKTENSADRWSFNPVSMKKEVAEIGRWQEKASYETDGTFLQIFKKLDGKKRILPPNPKPSQPRVCIARYGALGDGIIMTPLLRKLKEDGYHVTLNIAPYCYPVFENNPNIDNIIWQEREMVPNPELGEYWKIWIAEYDRYINLSESLEGRYLKVENRRDFYTSKEWRIATGDFNYTDMTMRLGGYPEVTGSRGELFFTNAELRHAQQNLSSVRKKFTIIWALNGSSHHKVYPQMELVVLPWLESHPDSVIFMVGDRAAKLPPTKHERLVNMVDKWSIRESLAAAKLADLVIGPETMMTNAAGCMGTNVITLLSHSTHNALCKYWGDHDFCLAPENTPCYPCFQLHYSLESCPIQEMRDTEKNETLAKAPRCALTGIMPERLLARIGEVYEKFKLKSGIINTNGPVG